MVLPLYGVLFPREVDLSFKNDFHSLSYKYHTYLVISGHYTLTHPHLLECSFLPFHHEIRLVIVSFHYFPSTGFSHHAEVQCYANFLHQNG